MNREVKVIIPNMREFSTFYSDKEGVLPMFFKKDWKPVKEEPWKPSEEQMEALRRAVNKLAKTDVSDSVRLSIMYDNLKKLM